MIVFGDTARHTTLKSELAEIARRLGRPQHSDSIGANLDGLRSILVLAGQCEQGVEDLGEATECSVRAQLAETAREITDLCAGWFYAGWLSMQHVHPGHDRPEPIGDRRRDLLALLNRAALPPDMPLAIKDPEGFAFYALYPEQYCLAVRRWMAEHPATSARSVLIVGVRSIGTTLSAVTKAVLTANGYAPRRMTVRPSGHPYSRTADIPATEAANEDGSLPEAVLIVDEGPGQSGSSMAAVVDALTNAGVPRPAISLLPGHAGMPGTAASDHVRDIWRNMPRFVASPDDLRWHGRSVREALAAATASLLGIPEEEITTEDFGGGLWRQAVFADPDAWPAVCPMFEMPKYRCSHARGALLWKFEGLGDARRSPGHTALAADGRIPAMRGRVLGFSAYDWIDGHRLTRPDGQKAAVLRTIGRHIVDASGVALSERDARESLQRLMQMTCCNLEEGVGGQAAGDVRARYGGKLAEWARWGPPSYGDGRMAPYEWVRSRSGGLVKTDCGGHDRDHTMVGHQAIAWDIAGAIVEWDLDERGAADLIDAVQAAAGHTSGEDVLRFHRASDGDMLRFHCLAYAAFRFGQTTFCLNMTPIETTDSALLSEAAGDYRRLLLSFL